MKKPLPEIFLSLFILAGLLSIFLFSSFVMLKRIPEINQSIVDRLVPVYKKNPITQEIIPQHNGINLIMIYLKNKSIKNNDKFIFSLYDNSHNEIRKIELSGSNIGDGETVRFQFDPIQDSAGKKFQVSLSAPETEASSSPIEIGYSNNDSYLQGMSSEVGDMSFQLFYRPIDKKQYINDLMELFLAKLNIRFVITCIISLLMCSRVLKLIK